MARLLSEVGQVTESKGTESEERVFAEEFV
jgi:hypothetical protein